MALLSSLQRAWERRPEALRRGDLVRVCDGAGDGLPHLIIDRFGAVAIVHLFESNNLAAMEGEIRDVGQELLHLYGVTAIYRWIHRKNARESAAGGAELLAGEPVESVWCTEGRVRCLIKPGVNVNGGLFLDTRHIRAELAATSSGHRVLNTFCFTGSLGLAAWCGGAREVVQNDISKGILQWARENFAGNAGQGTGEMRFIAEDSRAFMERELRRIERGDRVHFDTVIVDPPSFGSSGGVTFSVEDDIVGVVTAALQLVRPGGRLFLTTNFRSFSLDEIGAVIRAAGSAAGRSIDRLTPLLPPAEDFTANLVDSYAMRGFLVTVG